MKLLTDSNPEIEIVVITSFSKKAKVYLSGIVRVNILRWSELEEVADWCRSITPG